MKWLILAVIAFLASPWLVGISPRALAYAVGICVFVGYLVLSWLAHRFVSFEHNNEEG